MLRAMNTNCLHCTTSHWLAETCCDVKIKTVTLISYRRCSHTMRTMHDDGRLHVCVYPFEWGLPQHFAYRWHSHFSFHHNSIAQKELTNDIEIETAQSIRYQNLNFFFISKCI